MTVVGDAQKIPGNRKNPLPRLEILIVGMGGEGVVLSAELLSLAATLDGKFASQRSTYGASQRGEAIFSEVVISDKPIQFTFVEKPTHFIALCQQGFDTFNHKISNEDKTEVFIDWSQKFDIGKFDKEYRVIKFEAREIALNNKIPKVFNIIFLSGFIKSTGIISETALENAIKEKLKSSNIKENLKALELGRAMIHQ